MKKKYIFIIIFFCVSCFNCQKEEFSPIGEIQKKLVVFGVLDTRTNIQLIKVQNSYLYSIDSTKNNYQKIPANIKISITDEYSNIYSLKDTTIEGVTNYAVYYIPNFNLVRGIGYSLSIQADGYVPIHATAKVPSVQYIGVSTQNTEIVFQYGVHKYAKGYTHHFYLNYDIIDGQSVWSFRIEVPYIFKVSESNPADTTIIYPFVSRDKEAHYPVESLYYIFLKIKPTNVNQKVVVKRGTLEVLSLDDNLYNYYLLVQGFNDPYSVRLDRPFFSNVTDGYGIFGSITADSNQVVIPSDLITAFGYINGQ